MVWLYNGIIILLYFVLAVHIMFTSFRASEVVYLSFEKKQDLLDF